MIPLVVSVFLASVLGSLHCAGMCGAFVAFAVTPTSDGARAPARATLHAAYHGGRLVTYAMLGALAGLLGSMVDLGGSLVGAQRVAGALAAATVATFGVFWMLRALGVKIGRVRPPMVMQRLLGAGHRRAMNLPPITRAAAIGLLTTLLPCGWLYAFVATAAGTADPIVAVVVMTAFWAGTLPTLVAVGVSARAIAGPIGRATPVLMPALVTVVALGTIVWRSSLPARLDTTSDVRHASLDDAVTHARTLGEHDHSVCAPAEAAADRGSSR